MSTKTCQEAISTFHLPATTQTGLPRKAAFSLVTPQVAKTPIRKMASEQGKYRCEEGTTMKADTISQLADELGHLRTARKPWRCTCANPIRCWQVETKCGTGTSWSTHSTEAEAQEVAAQRALRPCHGGRYCEGRTFEIKPIPNPNYREGCDGDIPVGTLHYEYMGDALAYQSGSRYCLRCATEVWGA